MIVNETSLSRSSSPLRVVCLSALALSLLFPLPRSPCCAYSPNKPSSSTTTSSFLPSSPPLLLLPISRLESVAQEVIKSFNRYIHFDFISSFSNPRHVGRRQEGRMRQRASHSILPQCAGPQEADSGTWVGLACQLPGAFSVRRQINAKEKNIQAQARPAVPPS